MVNIEPYQYQKVTNIKEHNDIVAKINEIVDVINNSGADTLGPRVDKLETDVSAIDSAVKIQYQDIASIKEKDQAQDNNIGTLNAQVNGVSESLISNVNIIDGTTTGKFKVRLDREKSPSIDSNDYDLQKATSIELIQGSGPSMLKAQITLSDGTTLISDDFLFTTEAIGTDVYISSFVFKNGNVAGTISADIGLSNGTTIEANNFAVPMDPSLLNTVQDLSTRLSAVEGGQVGGLDELKAQVQTNTTNIGTLTTELDNLDIQKADQNNSNQEIVAGTIKATTITKGGTNVATVNDIPDISGKVDIAQGSGNAGKVLGVNASGNVEPMNVSGGEVWEEVSLTNFPTDWIETDRVKVMFKIGFDVNVSSWSSSPSSITLSAGNDIRVTNITEYKLHNIVDNINNATIPYNPIICDHVPNYIVIITVRNIKNASSWNSGTLFLIEGTVFNGGGNKSSSISITRNNLKDYISKMWRLKK